MIYWENSKYKEKEGGEGEVKGPSAAANRSKELKNSSNINQK